jgi:hypothetical protein
LLRAFLFLGRGISRRGDASFACAQKEAKTPTGEGASPASLIPPGNQPLGMRWPDPGMVYGQLLFYRIWVRWKRYPPPTGAQARYGVCDADGVTDSFSYPSKFD